METGEKIVLRGTGPLHLHCRRVAGARLPGTRAFPSMLASPAERLGFLRAGLLRGAGVVCGECRPGKSEGWLTGCQAVGGEHGACPGGGASPDSGCGMYPETPAKAGGSPYEGTHLLNVW